MLGKAACAIAIVLLVLLSGCLQLGQQGLCGNKKCEVGENSENCAVDCASFACGNGICEWSESNLSCPADCMMRCIYCGNGICDSTETNESCPGDCQGQACIGESQTVPVIAKPPSCCSGLTLIPPKEPNIVGISGICTAKCGNSVCDTQTESAGNCPQDCSENAVAECGNGLVEAGETPETCCRDAGCTLNESCVENNCVKVVADIAAAENTVIDFSVSQNLVYWIEETGTALKQLKSADVNTQEVKLLGSDLNNAHALAADSGYAYLALDSNDGFGEEIFRVSAEGSAEILSRYYDNLSDNFGEHARIKNVYRITLDSENLYFYGKSRLTYHVARLSKAGEHAHGQTNVEYMYSAYANIAVDGKTLYLNGNETQYPYNTFVASIDNKVFPGLIEKRHSELTKIADSNVTALAVGIDTIYYIYGNTPETSIFAAREKGSSKTDNRYDMINSTIVTNLVFDANILYWRDSNNLQEFDVKTGKLSTAFSCDALQDRIVAEAGFVYFVCGKTIKRFKA